MKPRNKEKIYIYERENRRCFHCGKILKFKQITLDHYLPLSKGGTHDIFNIVACCKKCNKIKGDMVPERYEDVILGLLVQAVTDDMIKTGDLSISNSQLKSEMLKINRIENITDNFIFQSDSMRFYIKDNTVIRVIHLGGKNEHHNYISREN